MFHELLENPTQCEPGPLQSAAQRLFTSVLQQSHFKKRSVGQAIPNHGKYVIIGVASYSQAELRLLDELEANHLRWDDGYEIVVFDMMECKNMADIVQYVPPFTKVVQTPVIAVWDRGSVAATQTGLHGTREVLQKAGLIK